MSVGIWQILLVVILILLLFGAGRLPRIMGDLAAGLKAFKQGMDDKKPPQEGDTDASSDNDIPGESQATPLLAKPKSAGVKKTISKKKNQKAPDHSNQG